MQTNSSCNLTVCVFCMINALYIWDEDNLPFESHFFNFLHRHLLLFLSCTCASAHTTPCSKLECWCFTHWHPDRPAQSACLWYARKIFSLLLLFLISVSWIAGANLQMSLIFYLIPRMIARYAPPISYNFLNLIRLGSDKTTIFEQVIIFSWFNVLLSSLIFCFNLFAYDIVKNYWFSVKKLTRELAIELIT